MAYLNFDQWFARVTGYPPHPWQCTLASSDECIDRFIRISTGLGKTAGTVLPWAYHRVYKAQRSWPARLVFCLPMRVLVEQTERAIQQWLGRAELDIPVVTLLGGRRESKWLNAPENPAVIVGTQDMLLSRAMMRGYGSARGLWPMEMGLLHRDALWVVDEVQLMDVGLATTAQLHAFRGDDDEHHERILRKTVTWWMSATLQPTWLDTIDFARRARKVPISTIRVEAPDRVGNVWAVQKTLERRADVTTPEEVAKLANDLHRPGTLTLVIVNTVRHAKKVAAALEKAKAKAEVRLIHSRFRGAEKKKWDFLTRDSKIPSQGRILVDRQDMSLSCRSKRGVVVT